MKIGKIEIKKNPNEKQRLVGIIGFCFFIGMAIGYIVRMNGW
jgi:hypothetical protein